MTKNQLTILRVTALVIGLLLLSGTVSFIHQTLAQPKPPPLDAALGAASQPAGKPAKRQYIKLTFEVLKRWTYVEGKSAIPGYIKAFDGQDVEMIGYMMPLNELEHVKEFLLVPNLWGCCYGEPPAVNHIVTAKMPAGQTTECSSDPVQIKGRFHVAETKQDGYLVSLYVLTVDKIAEAKEGE